MAIRPANDGESGEKPIWRGLARPDDLVTRWEIASRGPPSGFVGTPSPSARKKPASGLALMTYSFFFTLLFRFVVVGVAIAVAPFARRRPC
jgi:hypothetical protein